MNDKPTGRAERRPRTPIAAELFLKTLGDHGVDYFFANPGTDFPPIVEAFSRARESNLKLPRPVIVPHENVAVGMAHGAYLMNGRPQALMVHVNVGTANTINNILNMSRDRAPVILSAGRTPVTETGSFGSRSRPIHWAQEMFDQGGMLREAVKWDYELRTPGQIADVAARAYEVAMTPPRGPVYLVLPREPLSAPVPDVPAAAPRAVPAGAYPDPHAVATLAGWIAAAEFPLIITANNGRDAAEVEALARLAENWAIPVVVHNPRLMCLPSSHPMHFGFDPDALLREADLVIALESDVPWIRSLQQPASGARVAHIGEDPVYQRYPMRSFPADLAIAAAPAAALALLDRALAERGGAGVETVAARRARLIARGKERRAKLAAHAPSGDGISFTDGTRCVSEAVGPDAVVFNEYPLVLDHFPREKPGTLFCLSPAGGLGWGLAAALGAKLAAPERLIVAAIGDGAYMFTNPTVCHWVGSAHDLPVLTLVFNNSRYGAVRRATLSMFKDGAAGEDNGRVLSDLSPSPPFERMLEAQGGYGERVERLADLPGALVRARDAVLRERRQALLNIIIAD